MLRRFWFQFDIGPRDFSWPRTVLRAGCGVTGFSEEDCVAMIKDRIMKSQELPGIVKVVSDVDVRTLDANHVIPNMSVPTVRGIWFPKGFD